MDSTKRLLSWNVNGIRSMKGREVYDGMTFTEWLKHESPDVLCMQETKAHPDQLSKEILSPGEYFSYWHLGERKGYSGVGIYTKEEPHDLRVKFGKEHLDAEGRTMMADFGDYVLFNTYCPNGGRGPERVQYKIDYYEELLEVANTYVADERNVILTGDFNTAYKPIDLARPKQNENNSGFLPEEREALSTFYEAGFIDTFREYYPKEVKYTWWDYKTRARDRNVGWRIDYFYISANAKRFLKDTFIVNEVQGSDHCPIGIELDFRI